MEYLHPTLHFCFVTKVLNIQDIAEIEYERYNPKIGFIVDSDALPDDITNLMYCDFESQSNFDKKEVIVHKRR